MTSDARIPGQLKGENFAAYTVRRSYPATAKQVNAILKASETYADKGYNSFTRNCTIFVKDMIVSEAGIPAGKQIFEQETPGFSSLINFALFAEKASENTAKASAEARYARLGTDPDMNYGGDENFRVNQQDYRNYKESLAKSKGGYIGKVDLPNVAAENMRRLEGEDTGNIGSRYHFGTARINPATQAASSKELSGDAPTKKPEIEPDNIRDAIINESNSLINTILSVTRKGSVDELVRTPGIDRNVAVILKKISNYHLPLKQVKKLRNDPDKLRLARNNLENYVNDMNTLLFSFFKNDKRLHLPIMHMISLLEYGMYVVDFAYRDTDIGKNVGGDLRNLRGALNPLVPKEIRYNKRDGNGTKRVTAYLSPSRYEAYLQIYKSPHKAIDKAARYQELRRKANKTAEEEKEFQKLQRIDNLSYDYDAAHRYMVEKDSYSQQDVNYVFSLEKMEKMEATEGTIPHQTASSIYKSLILEKIFGGVSARLENNFNSEDVKDKTKLKEWLDNDMTTCIQRRPDDMKHVINGMLKSNPDLTQEQILEKLLAIIKTNWIYKVFNFGRMNKIQDSKNPLKSTGEAVPEAYERIAEGSAFRKKLLELIKQAINPDIDYSKGSAIIELD